MRTKSKDKGQGAKVKMAGVLLLVSAAAAMQGTTTPEPVRDVRQFDAWIYVLMDSAVCETCVSTDNRGVRHRVWTDAGRVMYQKGVQQESGRGTQSELSDNSVMSQLFRSCPVALSTCRDCESPLVFERQDGEAPWLVVMWREEFEGRFEVMCRYQYREQWPHQWGPTWNVTIRP